MPDILVSCIISYLSERLRLLMERVCHKWFHLSTTSYGLWWQSVNFHRLYAPGEQSAIYQFINRQRLMNTRQIRYDHVDIPVSWCQLLWSLPQLHRVQHAIARSSSCSPTTSCSWHMCKSLTLASQPRRGSNFEMDFTECPTIWSSMLHLYLHSSITSAGLRQLYLQTPALQSLTISCPIPWHHLHQLSSFTTIRSLHVHLNEWDLLRDRIARKSTKLARIKLCIHRLPPMPSTLTKMHITIEALYVEQPDRLPWHICFTQHNGKCCDNPPPIVSQFEYNINYDD